MNTNSNAADITNRTRELLDRLSRFVISSPWGYKYNSLLRTVTDSLNKTCRLAITGRVKAGKSSLVNVILDGDFAMVGTTETTATINIFKYGKPEHNDRPIQCEYTDGSTEWISKTELDRLQGNSEDIVKKISRIKHIVYYLEDERLLNTTLIDTPGLEAVVGEDGDAHQVQTEQYLGLRHQHEEDTITLSNNADAVVLLLGDVVHDSDKEFIDVFLRKRGSSSCINTIGLLAQIDLTDERIDRRMQNAKETYDKLSDYLSCVLPISAGLKRYMPSSEEARSMKDILSKIPSKEILDKMLQSEKMYLLPKIPWGNLSLEDRTSIYHSGTVPFRCFAVIAKTLYEHPIEKALGILNDISGIDRLRTILETHFFSRSKQIKCETAIRQALLIIWDILNCGSIDNIENWTDNQIVSFSKELTDLRHSLENLLATIETDNRTFQALVLLVENQSLFSPTEFEELKALFGNLIYDNDSEKLEYWYGVSNNANNELKREIARQAYFKYTDIAFQ